MADPKQGLNLVGTTVANIKNDLLDLANVIENQLNPKVRSLVAELQKAADLAKSINLSGVAGGGGDGGSGNNKVASSGAENRGGGGKGGAGFFAAANLIAQAMPSASTAVQQDLLTAQSAFYGQGGFGGSLRAQTGNVRALQNQLARMGIATNSMDTTRALAMAQNLGMSGATNFNQVMQGAAVASNFAPGIGVSGAVQATGTMNAPGTVNMLRTVGINVRGPNGEIKPIPQVVEELWNVITQGGKIQLSEQDVQIGLMPGNGLYGMLTSLFGGDQMTYTLVSNMLLAKARGKGKIKLGSTDRSDLEKMGLTTATTNKIARQVAGQTRLLTETASSISAGYGMSADLGNAMNNFAAAAGPLTDALGAFSGGYTGFMGLGNGTMGSIVKTGLGFSFGQLITKLLPMLFLAEGGPADAKTPYIVGERGPELFVPKTDGVVVPNNLLGRADGGGVKKDGPDTTKQLYNFLRKQGFSQGGAEGVIGNLTWESGLNPTIVGDKGTSFGIAQWHDNRWTALNKFAASRKLDPGSIEAQQQFLVHELGQKQYTGLLSTLKDPKTTKLQAAGDFMRIFERPEDKSSAAALKRANMYGKPVTGTYGSSSMTTPAPASMPSSALATTSVTTETSSKIQELIRSAAGSIGLMPAGMNNTFNNGPITINVSGVNDPKKIADQVQQELAHRNIIVQAGNG